jgi:penicillin-binding protein 2
MNSFFVRRYVIAGIFITIILLLAAKLFYIQIIDDQYSLTATKNVLRPIKQYPARGPILDRNGKVLVQNEAFYDIMVIPKQVKPFDTVEFCRLLNIDKAEFDKRFEKAIRYSPNLASIFEKQLSAQAYASLQERLSEFPGFFSTTRYLRTYPDSTAAQFLGYIGEVTQHDIDRSNGHYQPGDYIGVTGVEKAYEDVLRGTVGVKNVVVNSHNVPQGSYENGRFDTAARAGERLISSLDIRIQKMGEQLMQGKVGSIVAIEPSTGEILAFVSSPTYDPNLLVGRERGNNAAKMYKDPYDPLLIRPIQAYYPPGSSFKPLSALIALQDGIITPQVTYNCPGVYWAGNHPVKCLEVHGVVDLSGAVAGSCNGYFSMVFQKLIDLHGPKMVDTTFSIWRSEVSKFGLGARLGVDMPNEGKGNLPTAAHYDKIYHKGGWRSSTVVSLAIGQGELEATPLQLANIECTIANHGFYYKPHLIKGIGDKDVVKPEYTLKNYVGISASNFEPLIDGMQAVVDHGTAAASKIPGIVMCGKTGTAQVHGEDNSVFVAFAPRDNPKIAIAVIVENAGQGAHWAAPIASYIVEKYLTDTIRRPMDEYNRVKDANLLPDLSTYYSSSRRQAVRDSLKKLKTDSLHKKQVIKPAIKSVSTKKNTGNKLAEVATPGKRRNHE